MIYATLLEGRDAESVEKLHEWLELDDDDDDEPDQRLAPEVPTSVRDPVAASLLAEYGDSLVTYE